MMQWNELKRIIGGWLRWHRFSRAVHWGLRGLAFSLGLVFLIALIFVPRHWMDGLDYIVWVFWGSQFGLWFGFLGGFAWPVNQVQLIHTFDQVFGLQERVSTAIEVQRIVLKNLPGRDVLVAGWKDRQLNDTLASARKVKPNHIIPFRWERKTLLFVYLMGFIIVVFWVVAQPQFDITDSQRAATQYVKVEIDRVQSQLDDIKQSKNLTQDQKDALSAPYLEAKNKMQSASNSEQVAAILSQAQQKFLGLSAPASTGQLQAVQSMGQILGQSSLSPFKAAGTALNNNNLMAAGQMMETLDLKTLTPEQRQAAQYELNQAGQALRFSSPQIGSSLLNAANALQSGNIQAAQTALADAGKKIEDSGNQTVAAQVAKNAANDLAQRQAVVAQQSNNPTKPGNVTILQKTALPGSQSGGTGGIKSYPGAQTNTAGVDSSTLDQIYSPQNSSGSTNSSTTAGTGQTGSGTTDTGLSRVPYVDVLPSFSESNNQAIENGSVPTYLQPLIRNYFNSLTPQ